ncbi:MAG: DKNYY domain-containing protein [Kiritimatiellales bacterium]|nr:DKNYY domain-containing protein [Kiritimatiellales bacterium]
MRLILISICVLVFAIILFALFGSKLSDHQSDHVRINGGGQYYTDGKSVFYRKSKMKDAELESFVDLNVDSYSKDANHVYRFNNIIKNANPDTFKTLNGDYAKDDNHIFFASNIVEEADINSFEVLKCIWKNNLNSGSHYARDTFHAFVRGVILEGIAPDKFFFETMNCEDIPY